MEMIKEYFNETEQGGQVVNINWDEFENDFLKQSIEGVKMIDFKGNITRDMSYDEVVNKLNISEIKEIKYIPDELAVKLLYIDGKYDRLYRE
jgi:uncharacterized protein YaiL (DUF2058 family)